MKPPPFLLLAALLFWGWLSDFLFIGAAMGVVLELPNFSKFRWELDDADFNRIWSFCVVLNVALVVYVFTNNDAGGLNGLLHGNTVATAVHSGVLTTSRFMRWLPMTLFPFIVAQMFNERSSVPLTAISLVLRWRRRHGDQAFAGRYFNIAWPYFIVCVFAAGIHANDGSQVYFWGNEVMLAWALWSLRPARFSLVMWLGALLVVFGLGFSGMGGLNLAQREIQNFNAKWMEKLFNSRTDPLQSMTSMGRIGRLKLSARIVVWIEPHEIGRRPEYLREASYRNYAPQKMTWFAGGVKEFEPFYAEPDGSTWNLLPGKKNAEAISIACYLNGRAAGTGDPEGLLPLPSGSSRLEKLPVFTLGVNRGGAVLASGLGLVVFDAHYGPGATLDSPPILASTNLNDLTVPPNEIPALQSAIAEINFAAATNRELKLLAVEKFFFEKFTYSTWQGFDKKATTNATPLTKFLTTSRNGHCEYFASATVLLLRQLGIPARYAVGYAVHEPRGIGYVVRERDAHAWCLVWNEAAKCWEDFDTTPPSWIAIESQRTEFGEWFANLRSWLGFQIAKFRWGKANFQQYVFWALIPVMLVLLYHILFRRRKKRRVADNNQDEVAVIWPGLDSEFYQLEKKLAARGLPRQPGETSSTWLERALAEPAVAELRVPLQALLHLHYRHRFDPPGLSTPEREQMRREAKVCLDVLLQMKA